MKIKIEQSSNRPLTANQWMFLVSKVRSQSKLQYFDIGCAVCHWHIWSFVHLTDWRHSRLQTTQQNRYFWSKIFDNIPKSFRLKSIFLKSLSQKQENKVKCQALVRIQAITFWKKIAKQVSSHGRSPNVRPAASQRLVICNSINYCIDLVLNVFALGILIRSLFSACNPFEEVNRKMQKMNLNFKCCFRWQKPVSIGTVRCKRMMRPLVFCAVKYWMDGNPPMIHGSNTENIRRNVHSWNTVAPKTI